MLDPQARTEIITMNSFTPPSFESGDVELRFENGEVMVYGTPRGLTRLADFCLRLAKDVDLDDARGTEHIHLKDYQLLSTCSLRGTIAVFRK
jgi:hypothetical protein